MGAKGRRGAGIPWVKLSVLLLFVALAAVFVVGCPANYVHTPALELRVTDEGTPVSGAKLSLMRWSNPHHRFDGYEVFPVDTGSLKLRKETKYERVYPLCMHGVPQHYFSLCVHAPGYRDLVIPFEADKGPIHATLTRGVSRGTCEPSDAPSFDRLSDDDIRARDEVWRGAFEIISASPEKETP